ncbi:hypothetical protein AAFF_G00120260 [Aldrovandia affinis]|uniref:Uncharacterized protein n=1 Tax=Aldrovandia affinis TaxID=143900 RepID=A0AAD7WAG6_9TELE|nr:hypothetical protein AAFF_G00120260 [Aldrovandia affinis]
MIKSFDTQTETYPQPARQLTAVRGMGVAGMRVAEGSVLRERTYRSGEYRSSDVRWRSIRPEVLYWDGPPRAEGGIASPLCLQTHHSLLQAEWAAWGVALQTIASPLCLTTVTHHSLLQAE